MAEGSRTRRRYGRLLQKPVWSLVSLALGVFGIGAVGVVASGRPLDHLVMRYMPAPGQAWSRPVDPEREADETTRHILETLALTPGQRIADIGAGAGFFTLLFAETVGPSGKVVATDINRAQVEQLTVLAAENGLHQIETRLVWPDAPDLGSGKLDWVFLNNVFAFRRCQIEQSKDYLEAVASALDAGGRLLYRVDIVRGPHREGTFHCGDMDEAALVAAAEPWFSLVHREPGPILTEDRYTYPIESGFLIVLQKRSMQP